MKGSASFPQCGFSARAVAILNELGAKFSTVDVLEDDDIRSLADTIGIDRLMFGSDYPHTDGLAEPAKFAEYLEGFGPDEVRKIMHDNARGLLSPKAVG